MWREIARVSWGGLGWQVILNGWEMLHYSRVTTMPRCFLVLVGANLLVFLSLAAAQADEQEAKELVGKAQELAKNKLDGAAQASPAIVDGAIFLRTDKALYRIENAKLAASE